MAEPMQMDMQYWGTSDEDKPTNVPKNSIYFELDTCTFYYYDGEQWGEMPCGCKEEGMTYDIIIETTPDATVNTITLNDIIVKKGNPLDLEDKVEEGKIISGLFIFHNKWNSIPIESNIRDEIIYLPLTAFVGPYRYLEFATTSYGTISNNNTGSYFAVCLRYDKSTGEFNNLARTYYNIGRAT